MTELRISRDLALPVDAVTQPMAILARRGAGKTYTASVFVEEVIRASVPVVILDPTGAWWGLRSSADGLKPGLGVVIFGGEHAHVALEPTAGVEIASVILEHPGAYILDLSGLPSKLAEQRFAADFLERLYRGKKRETGPLLVVVDEADIFAPQRPGTEQIRTLGALESIVRRGRIKGLGDLLITQRAAVLNKNVLTQTEILIAMQTTGPQDRAAIDAWIEGNGTPEERAAVMGSLASMERGEAWVWSPSFLRVLTRIRIRTRTTFDSSRTPGAGEVAIEPRAFAEVDLVKLGARIAATVEKAKADDPKELRKQIAALQRDLAGRPTERVTETVVEWVEVPVLNGEVARLEAAVAELHLVGAGMITAGTGLAGVAQSITDAIARVAPATIPMKGRVADGPRGVPVRASAPSPAGGDVQTVAATRPLVAARPAVEPVGEGAPVELTGYARKLLDTLASRHPMTPTRSQLAALSRSSPRSSAFDGAIALLRRGGYVDVTDSMFRLTERGFEATGGTPSTVTTPAELLEQWRNALEPTPRLFLDVLVAAYPGRLSRDELFASAQRSPTSSSSDGGVAILRKMGLVESSDAGLRVIAELVDG